MCTIIFRNYTLTIHEFIYVADDGTAGPSTNTTGATIRFPRDSTSMLHGLSASSCRSAASTAFLALTHRSTCYAARQTGVSSSPNEELTRALRGPSSLVLFLSFALFSLHALSHFALVRHERPSYTRIIRSRVLPSSLCSPLPSLHYASSTKTTMRLPPRPAIPRCLHFHVQHDKAALAVCLSRPLCSRSSLSLSFSLARAFAGRKARYAEIVRSECRPPNERASFKFPLILSRTPLLLSTTALFLLHFVVVFFFFFTTTSSSFSFSFSCGGDGGFQRDVLAAANSMRDESSTVTDTTGQRSIAEV